MDFLILGNDPFLDFINTKPVVDGEPVELLATGGDLLNLLGRLGLAGTPALSKTVDESIHREAAQARAMREDFRALLKQLFLPQSPLPSPLGHDLAVANEWLARLGPPALAQKNGSLVLGYDSTGLIAPLLRAAIDLFTSTKYQHIRKCANPDCVLWYVDTTKSQTRRWCSMAHCGNAHKAKQFRKRHQKA